MANALAALGNLFATILAGIGFKETAQQLAIFVWIHTGKGNLVVRARAGTGKTTTMIASLAFAREGRILLAAFGRKIADELNARIERIKGKLRSEVEARSFHSIGNGIIWYYLANRQRNATQVDNSRGRRLARRAIEETEVPAHPEMVALVARMASLGKNIVPMATTAAELMMPVPLDPTKPHLTIAQAFEITVPMEFEESGWDLAVVEQFAVRAMALACEKEKNAAGQYVYDYDDQIFLPVRMKWARPRYDLIIVDEAQDMNPCQLLLAKRLCAGRLSFVGDDMQAIFAFRGADSDALDRLKKETNAQELGLTVTFRCPKKIVDLAKTLVPDYEAAESAPDGEIIEDIGWEYIYENAQGGDFVLSRTNAPLSKICIRLLKDGKRAFINGRDIGDDIISVIKKIPARTTVELVEGLAKWVENQMAMLQAEAVAKAGPDAEVDERKVEAVYDMADVIKALAEDLLTVPEVIARVRALFVDDDEDDVPANAIMCSTVHRAKGLEADNVFVLRSTLRFNSSEERNIAYVAWTRAKKLLALVEGR